MDRDEDCVLLIILGDSEQRESIDINFYAWQSLLKRYCSCLGHLGRGMEFYFQFLKALNNLDYYLMSVAPSKVAKAKSYVTVAQTVCGLLP
jgi:hypothetical protein